MNHSEILRGVVYEIRVDDHNKTWVRFGRREDADDVYPCLQFDCRDAEGQATVKRLFDAMIRGELVTLKTDTRIYVDTEEESQKEVDALNTIFNDIYAERKRQVSQWGGEEYEDSHNNLDWCQYIEKQTSLLRLAVHRAAGDADADHSMERERLVQVATLAVAALQSFDRKHPRVVVDMAQLESEVAKGGK